MFENLIQQEDGSYTGLIGAKAEAVLEEAAQLATDQGIAVELHLGAIPRSVDLTVQPGAELPQLLEEFHDARTGSKS